MHGFYFDPAWLTSLRSHKPVGVGVWIITLAGCLFFGGIILAAIIWVINLFGWGGFVALWPVWAVLATIFGK